MLRLSVNVSHKLFLNTTTVAKKVSTSRCLHIASSRQSVTIRNSRLLGIHRYSNRLAVFPLRYESTTNAETAADLLNEIPDPPKPPVQEIIESIVAVYPNGEPTFQSLGLCNYTGPGVIEKFLEYLHIGCDLPWWLSIAIITMSARLVVFPFIIMAHKNSAAMHNNMPQLQEIQLKMTEARKCGNEYEAALYAHQLTTFFKEKGIKPLKNMFSVFAQAPIFISCFFALRKMANIPVESMKVGGLWWFPDLTVPDPYYLLPLITCATFYLTLHISVPAVSHSGSPVIMKTFMKAIPFVMFPFMINFPGAVLCYWVTTNFITLIQLLILKLPAVRTAFDIPILKVFDPKTLPIKQKGFMEEIKNSWTNITISKDLENRQNADRIQFRDAGRGAIIKTYKYDPTKQPQDVKGILAKKR